MKIIIIIFMLLFSLSMAYAENSLFWQPIKYEHNWNTQDFILQSIFTLALICDWNQTLQFHNFRGRLHESNPILGRYPSRTAINLYSIGYLLSHTIIAYYLPRPLRTIWQVIFIYAEVWAVNYNRSTPNAVHVRFGGHTIF